MSMSQKEAVFQAVSNLYSVESGVAVALDKEQRASIIGILVEGFKTGKVNYDGAVPEESTLRAYCSGLLSNWLRKDTRLNGGEKYQAKNPGSRAGSTDPQVKAMRALLKTKSDPAEVAEIQAFINKRLAEIKPAKTEAAPTINAADLPEELRHLI